MPEQKRTHGSILQMMDRLLEQADLEKQATNLDLASDSKSTHPSSNVDDGTRPATEGARSAENKADVAKDVPANVEEAGSKNQAGGSKKPTDDMGTQSMGSDEGLKGNVDTPKSTPSMANNEAVGPNPKTKFGADQLIGEANSILADLAKIVNVDPEKAAAEGNAEKPAEKPAETKPEGESEEKASEEQLVGMYKEAAEKYPEDEEAGYVAATMLMDYLDNQKSANDRYSQVVDTITKKAQADAENYVSFLRGYQDSLSKAAQDPAALAALAGAAPGADAMPPDMGGAMPPDMGGGAAPDLAALGGEGGEMGGAGPDDEAVIEALAEALDEAGITPEELAEAVAEAQGGEAPVEEAAAAAGAEEGAAEGVEEGAEEAVEKGSSKKQKPLKKQASKKDTLKEAVRKLIRG